MVAWVLLVLLLVILLVHLLRTVHAAQRCQLGIEALALEHGLGEVLELEQLHLLALRLVDCASSRDVLVLHWILLELGLDVLNIMDALGLVLGLLGGGRGAADLAHADLLVALQGQVHAVFSESDLQVISEVPQLVPRGHLLLREGSPHQLLQVLVVPHIVLIGVRQ
ncbi:MAG: hypothetical protein ACMG6E_07315 [Candidatus Roizmanbacteria bacterium]